MLAVAALAALFQGFSIVSPLANAFAIPAVSFAITPLTLAATILPFDWPLERAHMLTAWMMQALHWLSSSPLALREQPLPPPWLLATAMAAAILLILPRGTPGRLAALALIGGFLCWQPERPRSGDFRATVLDVGQGLAIHVQTAHHDLLYDSGPLYGAASDAGERVVTPYLRALGVRRLDKAMISHDDADHAGGLESVRARVTVAETIAGDAGGATYEIEAPPERSAWNARGARLAPVYGTPCISGLRWRWDEVDFTVLAPDGLSGKRRDNAESCVLRISAAGGASLLLTGDMESSGENRLLEHLGDALASTAVVAGHHGSRSSSSPAFVAAVRPDVAIFSAGYRNRYGHPHPVVLSRWAVAGARNLRTDGEGSVLLASEGEKVKAVGWRELHPRYWHGR
jgi:competence protein ComEC